MKTTTTNRPAMKEASATCMQVERRRRSIPVAHDRRKQSNKEMPDVFDALLQIQNIRTHNMFLAKDVERARSEAEQAIAITQARIEQVKADRRRTN